MMPDNDLMAGKTGPALAGFGSKALPQNRLDLLGLGLIVMALPK
jgi:hypothetical protein